MFPPKATCTTPDSGLLSTFKLILLEHMILCRMVQGQMPQAIKEVNKITCVGMLNAYPGLTCMHMLWFKFIFGLKISNQFDFEF